MSNRTSFNKIETPWVCSPEEIAHLTGTNLQFGLSASDSNTIRKRIGSNYINTHTNPSICWIIFKTFANPMNITTFFAIWGLFTNHCPLYGSFMTAVFGGNMIIGIRSLIKERKKLVKYLNSKLQMVSVLKNGIISSCASDLLVLGDVVQVRSGDYVTADMRLIESSELEVDEKLLTGALDITRKSHSAVIPKTARMADQRNMLFAFSKVTKGQAMCIVVATGENTQMGEMIKCLKSNPRQIKLPRYFKTLEPFVNIYANVIGMAQKCQLSRQISIALLLFTLAGVAFGIFILNFHGMYFNHASVLFAVTAMISLTPLSTPLVTSMCDKANQVTLFSKGILMNCREALMAMASIDAVCIDLEGTITHGRKIAVRAWVANHGTYSITEVSDISPYDPTVGGLRLGREQSDRGSPIHANSPKPPAMKMFLDAAAMANTATIESIPSRDGEFAWSGYGTEDEAAIQSFVARFGWTRALWTIGNTKKYQFVKSFSQTFDNGRYTTLYYDLINQVSKVWVKGEAECVLNICSYWCKEDGSILELDNQARGVIQKNFEMMYEEGLRVVALAGREILDSRVNYRTVSSSVLEKDLVFYGFVGLCDVPKEPSILALRNMESSSRLNVHVFSNSDLHSSMLVARKADILPRRLSIFSREILDLMVTTGEKFDRLSNDQIDQLPVLPLLIAQCTSSTKIKMISALQRRNQKCAMISDLYQSTPAMNQAEVSICVKSNYTSKMVLNRADFIVKKLTHFSYLEQKALINRCAMCKVFMILFSIHIGLGVLLAMGLSYEDLYGLATFDISLSAILWVVMIAMPFPIYYLFCALQEVQEVYMKSPSQFFSYESLFDIVINGVSIGLTSFLAYSFVVTNTPMNSAAECGYNYILPCFYVFQGRSIAFGTTTISSVILTLAHIDPDRSLFSLSHTRFCTGTLAVTCLLAAMSPIPMIMIPLVDAILFLQTGVLIEWAYSAAGMGAMLLTLEAWKLVKTGIRWICGNALLWMFRDRMLDIETAALEIQRQQQQQQQQAGSFGVFKKLQQQLDVSMAISQMQPSNISTEPNNIGPLVEGSSEYNDTIASIISDHGSDGNSQVNDYENTATSIV